jgi:hypothetical protein
LIFIIFLSACKTSSFFITPNEVKKEKVVLVFRDQTKKTGNITVLHESYNSIHVYYNDNILFSPEGKDSTGSISLNDVAGYWYNSDYYALKYLDIQINNSYRLLFAKRLTTDSSKIQLYELYESGEGNETGQARYSYFVSLPGYGEQEATNVKSSKFVPFFEQKMSMIVSDCPALAKKIQTKTIGYFIPMGTFNGRTHPDVMMKIIDEYNHCDIKPGS